MKKFAINILSIGVLAAAFTSCDDAKNDVIENRVYIAEAASTPLSDILMGDEGTVVTAPVTIRLAKPAATDVAVKLAMRQSDLDEYNKRNQTTYEIVPSEYVSMPEDVVIKAGELSASVPVQVTAFKGEGGINYALPVAIATSNGMESTVSTSKFIYALAAPLKQAVPSFRHNNGCRLQPADTDWGLRLSNYTLEWWVRVTGTSNPDNGYSVNNQAIFANGSGNTELYIRFGDLVYSEGYRYKNNFLQVKTMGSQFDTGDPTKGKGLENGAWYHFALTYDASTGTTILYKNGSPLSQLTTAVGTAMEFDHLNMFDSGSSYFRDNVEMAQVRLWKVTRSADQIANFMRKEVRYTDPNLVFYLPMNEGEGATVLKDVTGNGHDMQIGQGGSNGSKNTAFAWNEYDFSSL